MVNFASAMEWTRASLAVWTLFFRRDWRHARSAPRKFIGPMRLARHRDRTWKLSRSITATNSWQYACSALLASGSVGAHGLIFWTVPASLTRIFAVAPLCL